jgi:hypothetical protein
MTLPTGQALRFTGIFAGAVATIALCVGAFHLGYESASARIYERQAVANEHEKAGLMALVGIVDQAKAREFSSCVQAGKKNCESIIAPVVP